MAEPTRITRHDMEIAARNVAARRGWTLDELRARLRNPPRPCSGPSCTKTFPVHDDRQRYCSDDCKAAAARVRNRAAS